MSLQLIRPDINLDFVGKRHFFVILSTVINIAAIVLLFTRGNIDLLRGTGFAVVGTRRPTPYGLAVA